MVRKGKACPHCLPKQRWFNRTAVTHFDALATRLGLLSLEGFVDATTPRRVRCRRGHERTKTLADMRRGTGCQACSAGQHLKIAKGEALARFAGKHLQLLVRYTKANDHLPYRCTVCGHEGNRSLTQIRTEDKGCTRCDDRLLKQVEAAAAVPEMRSYCWDPDEPYPGATGIPWRCRCMECGRIRHPTLSRARSIKGCDCSHRDVFGLPAVSPEDAFNRAIDRGWIPQEQYQNCMARWKCACATCGAIGYPTLNNMGKGTRKRDGCAACVVKEVSKEGLASAAPEARRLMLRAGAEPIDPFPGVSNPWNCRCLRCDRVITPRLANVARQGPCWYCAPRGINPEQPSVVYLIHHREMAALKIGVSNVKNWPRRRRDHRKEGWQVINVRHVGTGVAAEAIEQAALCEVRERGYPIWLPKRAMPQGGHTETFSDDISMWEVWQLVRAQEARAPCAAA